MTRPQLVGGSEGTASLLVGNRREPLRLTLDTSTLKKLHSLSWQHREGFHRPVLHQHNASGLKPWLWFPNWTNDVDMRQNTGFPYAVRLLRSQERSHVLDRLWVRREDRN